MGNAAPKPKQTSQILEELEEESNVSSFTCGICIEPSSSNKRFRSIKKCSRHSFCLDCVEKYVEAKVEEYNMSEIKCPGLDCNEQLDPVICRSFLSVRVFEKWCEALCEATLLHSRRAYCPYSDCSTLIVDECGGKIRKTKCPNCKKLFCFECKIPWHAGYSCSETEEMRGINDVLLGKLMERKKWQRCPSCKNGVERISGCPVVRCRCGTRFCHLCGRKWCGCQRGMVIFFRAAPYHFCICAIIFLCICVIFVLASALYEFASTSTGLWRR